MPDLDPESSAPGGKGANNPTSNTKSAEQPPTPISQHDYFNLLGSLYLKKVAELFPERVICDQTFNRYRETIDKVRYVRDRAQTLVGPSQLEELADDQTALSDKDLFFINTGINSLLTYGGATDDYAVSTFRDITASMDNMQVLAFFYGVGLLLKQERPVPATEGFGGLRGFMNYYIHVFENNHSGYMADHDSLKVE